MIGQSMASALEIQANEEMDCAPLCKNFKVIMVGGFGASVQEVEEGGWRFLAYLRDLSNRHRWDYIKNKGKLELIVNSSRRLYHVDNSDVQKLLGAIPDRRCPGAITCVIFAHSHGAKVVLEALTTGLNNRENIAANLAVVAYGGIEIIPADIARVVRNFRLEDDAKSLIGTRLLGQNANEMFTNCTVLDDGGGRRMINLRKSLLPSLSSAALKSELMHDTQEYLANRTFLADIEKALMLNRKETCQCPVADTD